MPKLKDIPVCPSPPAERASGRVEKRYRISLITPLFGGGAEPGQPDEDFPIRGTAIRGQLEFWWRATCGATFATHKDLFARHAKIWGTTEKASSVEVSISHTKICPLKRCANYTRKKDGKLQLRWEDIFKGQELPYALFPFQGQLTDDRKIVSAEPAQYIEDASFTLKLRYPQELSEDVEAAVRAWVNFGGLGARTRRGCGALLCKELAPKNAGDLEPWFRDNFKLSGGEARPWPTIPGSVLAEKLEQTPIDAWKKVIGLLQKLRQGKEVGRNKGGDKNPGRSRWPEPETIRRVIGKRSRQHARMTYIPDDAFPRAEFGLPIVFHFKDKGDPPDTVLYPSDDPSGEPRERMASPLILKPLALANGKAVPLILHLVTPPLTGVVLKQGSDRLPLPSTTVVRDKHLASYPCSPLSASASGSAIDAFLSHARGNGFREIKQ